MIKKENELKKNSKGITLIALVITIIVLLILARSKYSNINWREWDFNKSRRCKNKNRWGRKRRARKISTSRSTIKYRGYKIYCRRWNSNNPSRNGSY